MAELSPISFTLTPLNVGWCSDPAQTPIAADVSASPEVGVLTPVDVVADALYLQTGPTPTVLSTANLVNCTASITSGALSVTGTTTGAGSLDYTLSGGGDFGTAVLTLDVLPDSGLTTVTLTDVTATGFDESLSVSDQIQYSNTSAIEGAAVAVNGFGRVTVTGTYTPGDSFTYRINGGVLQTYTFG